MPAEAWAAEVVEELPHEEILIVFYICTQFRFGLRRGRKWENMFVKLVLAGRVGGIDAPDRVIFLCTCGSIQ